MHFRRFLGAALVVGSSALLAAGCGSGGSGGGSISASGICSVYGDDVSKSEYADIVKQAETNLTQSGQKAPKPGSTEEKQLQNQAVDYLIQQKLFEQQADKLKIKVTDSQVDSRLKQLVTSYFKGSESAYQTELKKQGITETTVKQRIREQLISEALFNKVTNGVKISDADAQKNYDQNPTTYQQKESRTVAHILVKTQALANTIYAQVKGGDQKIFAADAKKYSQDPSSAKMGGVLTITKGETVAPFDKVAFALKTGAVSPPVHTQFGWHVITARSAVTPAKQQPFSAVEAQIVSTLQQQQKSSVMQDFQTSLTKKAASHVSCKKGYTWTATVTNNTATAAAATTGTDTTATADTVPASTTSSSSAGSATATTATAPAASTTASTSATVPASTTASTTTG